MVRNILALSLLAVLLAAPPGLHAQTAPAGTAQPAADLVDPGAIQALKDMGVHLQTLKRFQVSTGLTGERVLADGQKLQHTATADMDVERPNKLRARMFSARAERELFYDGKTVTLWTPAQKYFSTALLSKTASVGCRPPLIGAGFGRVMVDFIVRAPMCCPRLGECQRGLRRELLGIRWRSERRVEPSHQIAMGEEIHAQQGHQIGETPPEARG